MAPLEGRDPESMQIGRLTRVDRFKMGRVDAVPAFQVATNLRWRQYDGSCLPGDHGSIQIVFVMPVGEADDISSGEILQMRPLGAAFRPEKRVEKQNPLIGFDAETRPAKIREPWFVGHIGLLQLMWSAALSRVISFDGFDPKDELGYPQNDLWKIHIQQETSLLKSHGSLLVKELQLIEGK
jgi:hypothetical protein